LDVTATGVVPAFIYKIRPGKLAAAGNVTVSAVVVNINDESAAATVYVAAFTVLGSCTENAVNAPVLAVVAPMDVLLIVLAAVGLMVRAPAGLIVTVPVPVGLIVTFALAGEKVTVLLAVKVVNAPEPGVPLPIAPGAAKVAPPSVAALIAELQPKPVFVVQIKAFVAALHPPIAKAVTFAVPLVALPSTVFVAICAILPSVRPFVAL
jgi:hypothetical protein